MLSDRLRVRVRDAGQVRVDLTFKAALAANLADLLPADLGVRLEARGLSVEGIAAEAARRDFAPGELFQLVEGTKHVRVWLE